MRKDRAMSLELELLEKEIVRLAKELGVKEKHIQRLLDGTYKGLWLVHNSDGMSYVLLTRKGKSYPQIKSTREWKTETIQKMRELAHLFRLYEAMKKTEELKTLLRQAREQETALATT